MSHQCNFQAMLHQWWSLLQIESMTIAKSVEFLCASSQVNQTNFHPMLIRNSLLIWRNPTSKSVGPLNFIPVFSTCLIQIFKKPINLSSELSIYDCSVNLRSYAKTRRKNQVKPNKTMSCAEI